MEPSDVKSEFGAEVFKVKRYFLNIILGDFGSDIAALRGLHSLPAHISQHQMTGAPFVGLPAQPYVALK